MVQVVRSYNREGRVIGENHPMAKLTDIEVDLILDLREDGMTIKAIAEKFEVPFWTVANIIYARRRCQIPAVQKPVSVES